MTTDLAITVGVLALQGAFIEHIDLFKIATATGYNHVFNFIEVRTEDQLKRCHALVIPGGESTAMSLVAQRTGLLNPLIQFVNSGKPIWGTCAGLIFLAREVVNGKKEQQILGGLDIQVKRNAFGRQVDSFEKNLDFSSFIEGATEFPTVFIRAPVITKTSLAKHSGPCIGESENGELIIYSQNEHYNAGGVEILHQLPNGFIVAVRQNNVLGTSFHPELTTDVRFHKWFIDEFVLPTIKL